MHLKPLAKIPSMASKPKESKTMRLKLLVDNRTNKVLFAEAGKDFVDFLLGLQQIPLGCITALLKGSGVAACGSLGRVYQSIVALDPAHLQPGTDKDALLRPKVFSSQNIHTPLANYFLIEKSQSCSFGGSSSSGSWSSSSSSTSAFQQTGWVKDGEMFMVKNDLVIQPLSPISAISLFNILHIKDLSSLEEKTVNIGIQEGLKILKALFESDTVLTDVFIQKTRPDYQEDYDNLASMAFDLRLTHTDDELLKEDMGLSFVEPVGMGFCHWVNLAMSSSGIEIDI